MEAARQHEWTNSTITWPPGLPVFPTLLFAIKRPTGPGETCPSWRASPQIRYPNLKR
jgi:hypothetical protein